MYRSIFVPLDGSSFSEHALPVAMVLARRSGAALHVIHVQPPSVPGERDAEQTTGGRTGVSAEPGDYLADLRDRLAAPSERTITYTTVTTDGSVARTLARAAAAGNANLIVMTTHGRGGPARLWLGSVADDLIRRSSVPILALRPDAVPVDGAQSDMFRQILIPLDGSPLAEGILEHALALGEIMQSEYILLQIVQPFISPAGARFPVPIEGDAAITRHRQRAAQIYLAGIARKLRRRQLRVRTRVRRAEQPAPAILAYARRHRADLIAVATHGHGQLRRFILGSVADKLLRGAQGPILLYRPPARDERAETAAG